MTTNLPRSAGLPDSGRAIRFSGASALSLKGDSGSTGESSKRLENRRRKHVSTGAPGLWAGTCEGMIATVIAVVAALLFGGAAGAWFVPGESGWLAQALKISAGTTAMGVAVCLAGSILSGRNPVFWGIGMPLLVYVAGSFAAFISGHAGATAFWFGAPLFCGLAIMAGVMTAFALDRDR